MSTIFFINGNDFFRGMTVGSGGLEEKSAGNAVLAGNITKNDLVLIADRPNSVRVRTSSAILKSGMS